MAVTAVKEMLRQAEAAEMLGLDEKTLESWRYGKDPHKLPFVKLGNAPRSPIRYKLTDVQAFIEANRRSNDTITIPARRARRRRPRR